MWRYRDKTFCGAACANMECDRNIAAVSKADIERVGLPVSMADFSPECPDYQLIKGEE